MRSVFRLCILITIGSLLPLSSSQAFEFPDVVTLAKQRADKAYSAPAAVPEFLRNLNYDEFQSIRFKPAHSLWRDADSRFQVMLMSPGSYYSHAVKISEVNREGVAPVAFDKTRFNYPNEELAKRVPADLGYAGFKLTFPTGSDATQKQFLVFGGASYFRGVGHDNRFGLSARGLAVDTGLPSGEQVPNFVEFWLERPNKESDVMRVFALLDGPAVTGAYQFDIHPGGNTRLDVKAQLFFRKDINLLGIAPLTSMFYYGENTAKPVGEWRPQVHDSDGLLIHDGETGEWLWRPVINPRMLRMNYLATGNVKGFGLMQRDRRFSQFEDTEARYDLRPSAWVETKGEWGAGNVVLIEIPTKSETNDNIVAFWQPKPQPKAGESKELEYTLSFGDESISKQPTGTARRTFVGAGDRVGGGNVENAIRVIVDFAGGPLDKLDAKSAVVGSASGGDGVEVLQYFVEFNESAKTWRLSMLVRGKPEAPIALRAFLSMEGQALTETWTYELPPTSKVRTEGE